ncbi:N-acetyl-gamma-glutamyl-phosphate reductase [Bibersteinia trehalosi USDA-ARS-USMARC-188]|uniref:N-acetyl-gamma-glutamyl-phosphate reductase n=1 Tax=Bibersteinia trehalosi USDA-ARS-USMARC-188 TaxID=1263829 RepID=A0A4V7IAZ7_BIBTR|nr:N-acetyl-gamma-glutamyl-phosphate reductase [Bibersteinia trehalosi]AHG82225.1 N-acetyl-gamma-glutamyl-phosphate reductase [Bibersteinia trehalosi USDA-ARS-USMARC-188]
MAKYKVFIDGAAGTTGLRIYERLGQATDIELLSLAENERKDRNARLAKIAEADITVLCLPDEASKEIIASAPKSAKICDTSTAFRTHSDWVYGFAELTGQKTRIQHATRVAVPGCHASGFIALVRPLIEKNALPKDSLLSCHSLTGYSGGGKAMIGEYQAQDRAEKYTAPRLYGLPLKHKHLPEMQTLTGLNNAPLFTPVVADFYSGMLVTVPLFTAQFNQGYQEGVAVHQLLSDYYHDSSLIQVQPFGVMPDDNMLNANEYAGKDSMQIFVYANESQILLAARFDNLGKGASGAAVQCLNLMLGRDETAGLDI